jgi:hypothetical protein
MLPFTYMFGRNKVDTFYMLKYIFQYICALRFSCWCYLIVLSRLDCGNGGQVGLPAHLLRRLQLVMNAVEPMIYIYLYIGLITKPTHPLRYICCAPRAHSV